MEIKVVQDAKSIDSDILVVSMFEGEKTASDLANTYALEQDNFKGKFRETYLLPKKKKKKKGKVREKGLGNKTEFNNNKMRYSI